MAIFLGLNPVFLLFEHAALTETLFIFAFLLFILISLLCVQGKLTWYKGVLLGLSFGICTLTRPNAVLLCLAAILGIFLVKRVTSQSRENKQSYQFAAGLVFAVLLVVGPWIWRNYALFHNISLANYNNRNLLIYQALHYSLDTSLPKFKEVAKSISSDNVNYSWLFALSNKYPTDQAESLAGAIVYEQVTHHPGKYLKSIMESFINFGSLNRSPLTGDRSATLIWFQDLVVNRPDLDVINNKPWVSKSTDFSYQPSRYINNNYDRAWSQTGATFIKFVRPVLFICYFLAGIVYIVLRTRYKTLPYTKNDYAIIILGSGYLLTVLLHAVTLLDSDRFTIPFDAVSLLVVILVCEWIFKNMSKNRMENC